MDLRGRFERRVCQQVVVGVPVCIAAGPNRRQAPIQGDVQRPLDLWFYGGAASTETGHIEYLLGDETKAVGGAPASALSITIEFPSGCRVMLQQDTCPIDYL